MSALTPFFCARVITPARWRTSWAELATKTPIWQFFAHSSSPLYGRQFSRKQAPSRLFFFSSIHMAPPGHPNGKNPFGKFPHMRTFCLLKQNFFTKYFFISHLTFLKKFDIILKKTIFFGAFKRKYLTFLKKFDIILKKTNFFTLFFCAFAQKIHLFFHYFNARSDVRTGRRNFSQLVFLLYIEL